MAVQPKTGDAEFVQGRWQAHKGAFRTQGFVPSPGGTGFLAVDRTVMPPTYHLLAVSAEGGIKALRGDLPDDRTAAGDMGALGQRILQSGLPQPSVALPVDEALRLFGMAGEGPGGLVELSLRRFAASLNNARLAARLPQAGLLASEVRRFAASGLDTVRGRLDPAALQALSSAETFKWRDYSFYAETGEKGAIRRAAASHFPLFATFAVERFSVRMALDAQVAEKRRSDEYLRSDEHREKLSAPVERGGETRTLEEWMRKDGRDPYAPWQLSEKSVRQTLQAAFDRSSEERPKDSQPRIPMHVFSNLRGVSWPTSGVPIDRIVGALAELPADWMPKTRPDWDAFCDLVAVTTRDVMDTTGTPLRTLFEGCGGKWAELRERMIRAYADTRPPEGALEEDIPKLEEGIDWRALQALPRDKVAAAAITAAEALDVGLDRAHVAGWITRRVAPDLSRGALMGAFAEMNEMVGSFARKVVMPAAARQATELAGARQHMLAYQHHVAALQAAARILLPGKSFVRLMEMTRTYINHGTDILGAGCPAKTDAKLKEEDARRRARINADAAMRIGIDPAAPIPEDGWAPLCPILEAPNGVWIVPLTDAELLEDEGRGWSGSSLNKDSSIGLSICVGVSPTYKNNCRRQGEHILSFRELGGKEGATFTRLACMQIAAVGAGETTLRAIQFMGDHNNYTPPEGATRAWEWFQQQVLGGAVKLNYEAIRERMVEARKHLTDEVELGCGYDWKNATRIAEAMRPWASFVGKKHRRMGPEELARDPDVASVVEALEPGAMAAAAAPAPGRAP